MTVDGAFTCLVAPLRAPRRSHVGSQQPRSPGRAAFDLGGGLSALGDAVRDAVGGPVGETMDGAVREAVGDTVGDTVGNTVGRRLQQGLGPAERQRGWTARESSCGIT